MTPAERKLWWEYLRYHSPRIIRQRPIDFYIADFYCAKAKLIIELDGQHHLYPAKSMEDARRTKDLESYGLLIIRYENRQVLRSFDEVCQEISLIIDQRKDWVQDGENKA